ncbi:unnamed protein product, partial [Ceratitis capitata]
INPVRVDNNMMLILSPFDRPTGRSNHGLYIIGAAKRKGLNVRATAYCVSFIANRAENEVGKCAQFW